MKMSSLIFQIFLSVSPAMAEDLTLDVICETPFGYRLTDSFWRGSALFEIFENKQIELCNEKSGQLRGEDGRIICIQIESMASVNRKDTIDSVAFERNCEHFKYTPERGVFSLSKSQEYDMKFQECVRSFGTKLASDASKQTLVLTGAAVNSWEEVYIKRIEIDFHFKTVQVSHFAITSPTKYTPSYFANAIDSGKAVDFYIFSKIGEYSYKGRPCD